MRPSDLAAQLRKALCVTREIVTIVIKRFAVSNLVVATDLKQSPSSPRETARNRAKPRRERL